MPKTKKASKLTKTVNNAEQSTEKAAKIVLGKSKLVSKKMKIKKAPAKSSKPALAVESQEAGQLTASEHEVKTTTAKPAIKESNSTMSWDVEPVDENVFDRSSDDETKNDDDENEVAINLDALDGYMLPEGSDSDDDQDSVSEEPTVNNASSKEPKKKRRKKSQKKKKSVLGDKYREQEEKRLEELLFGNLLQKFNDKELASSTVKVEVAPNEETYSKKRKTSTSDGILPKDAYGDDLKNPTTAGLKPAWVDEDDEEIKLKDVVASYNRGKGNHGTKEKSETNYKEFLQKTFSSIHGQVTPKWAEIKKSNLKKKKKGSDDDDDEESDDYDDDKKLSKTAADLLARDSSVLGKEFLKFKRVRELNHQSRAEGAIIKSVEFHKKQNVALVAGNSGVVSLFQVDGRTNAKIQSIRFDNFSLHQAQFSINGEEFLASSNVKGNIQVHNIVTGRSSIIPHNKAMEQGIYKDFVQSPDGRLIAFCGRFGCIHLMSARSKEWITSLKMNGEVQALTFSPDSCRLYSHGEHGEVYIWDMVTRSCVHKFIDDGCILGTAVAISPSQQFLACGSSSGVVNIYSTDKLENTSLPKPDKILLNLVTRATAVKFHPSSEMMLMASSLKENSIRLVHLPSMNVFPNFPTATHQVRSGSGGSNKNMARINAVDFSPNGGYLATGLNNGTAVLYRLPHYDQY